MDVECQLRREYLKHVVHLKNGNEIMGNNLDSMKGHFNMGKNIIVPQSPFSAEVRKNGRKQKSRRISTKAKKKLI